MISRFSEADMSYKGGDRAKFGIIDESSRDKDYRDEYEPDKYHCIAICDDALNAWWEHLTDMDTFFHTFKRPGKGLARWGITLIPPSSIPQLRRVVDIYTDAQYKRMPLKSLLYLTKQLKRTSMSFITEYNDVALKATALPSGFVILNSTPQRGVEFVTSKTNGGYFHETGINGTRIHSRQKRLDERS